MKIIELKNATPEGLADINELLKGLFHDAKAYVPLALGDFKKIVADDRVAIVAAENRKHIIGIGFLYVVLKPRGHYAYLEDMMVLADYRGRGIGSKIGRRLITVAKKRGVKTIELTARPSRIAANKLYKKLGFMPKKTNVYRMKL